MLLLWPLTQAKTYLVGNIQDMKLQKSNSFNFLVGRLKLLYKKLIKTKKLPKCNSIS